MAVSKLCLETALTEMTKQMKRAYKDKGPAGISIIGSGQYTIPEAYTASKFMKGGLRSNNIDPNARLCMASAVVGFYQTFGVDEPANCYADIEKADLFLLWGTIWPKLTLCFGRVLPIAV